MLNQTKNYPHLKEYSKDFKSHYSKQTNYLENLNVTTYQESFSTNLKDNLIRGQYFETKRSKQVPSPNKPRYNLENQTIAQKELYMKNRFDQIKKKYDNVPKRDFYQMEKVSPLKQVNKQSYKDISFNRFAQKSTNSYNNRNNQILQETNTYKKNIDYRNSYDKDFKINQEKLYNMNSLKKDQILSKARQYEPIKKDQIINKTKQYEPINTIKNYEIKSSEKKFQEQRIQSIDKINEKIQKIMKSINQNEKYSKHQINNQPITNYNRKISFGQIDNYDKSKLLQIKQEKVSSFTTNENKNKKDLSVNHKIQKKSELMENRSASLLTKPINNIEKSEYVLSNGKDIDGQIKKINDRIKKSEEQKRKLNIKFDGYQQFQGKNNKTIEIKKKQQFIYPEKSIQKIKLQNKRPSIAEYKRQQPISFKNTVETNTAETKLNKITSYAQKQFRIPKLSLPNYNNRSFYQQQNSKYQQQKIVKTQTNRLTECLKKQVQFDQSLRDAKLMFSFNDNSDKWKKLRNELEKNNINLNQSQMKMEFEITLEQHDPFFSIRQNSQGSSIESLVKKYCDAYSYFKNSIKNKFNVEILNNEKFKEQNLDLQKKGYLTVEDFVRYLNIQTGTFYRNRDLVLIFRRFTKENQLKFKEFIRLLSQ